MTTHIPLSSFDICDAKPVHGSRASAFGTVLHILRWPLRVVQARQVASALAGLSEHELRDIGLTGQDVRNITALPLDADPGRELAIARMRFSGAR